MKFLVFLLLAPLFSGSVLAQTRCTISGYVRDSSSGESMTGVTIFIKNTPTGTISNSYGFYSLSTIAGDIELVFNYLGHKSITKKLTLRSDTIITLEMKEQGTEIQEVVITENATEQAVKTTQMSVTKLDQATIQKIPAIFGEVDIIKAIQFLPGVKTGTEGSAGFYVRGGGPDQNLILLDEAVVYNASHLGGLFSVFNADAVKEVALYKGDFPAKYGGRLSSVLDVKMKEGNRKIWGLNAGIGIVSSRFLAEAPIVKDKASFLISGRRTYFDVITEKINQANINKPNYTPIPQYFFYDLNTKINWEIGKNDRLFLSGYFGQDIFGLRPNNSRDVGRSNEISFDFSWGNATTTLRWNHIFNPKLFSNTTALFSNYQYNIQNSFGNFKLQLNSQIQDYAIKTDFDWYKNNKHQIKFGIGYTYKIFKPGGLNAGSEEDSITLNYKQLLYGNEAYIYLSDDIDITNRLRIHLGLRGSAFLAKQKLYFGAEPRLALRYKLNENWALKSSYARMYQYIHLASSSAVTLPTDIWYPCTDLVAPQTSDQIAIGITKIFPKINVVITNEIYYKWMNNLVEFREGARLFLNPNLDQDFVFGKGTSYGNEILIEKKQGKWTGWIGYTLAWTNRNFEAINNGNPYPYKYDIRNDVAVILSYDISKRATVTAAWVYRTGNALTLPKNRFAIHDLEGIYRQGLYLDPNGEINISPGLIVPNYAERNSFRMPAFHRMDLSFIWKFNKYKRWEADLNISFYNLYNRRNPFFLYFATVKNSQGFATGFQAKLASLFPLLPSVTYNVKL